MPAGREPIPRGHLRHHAADGGGAQPVAGVGQKPHGLPVPIEVACPLGGGGGRAPGARRRPSPRQDRRRTPRQPEAAPEAAPQHGLGQLGKIAASSEYG